MTNQLQNNQFEDVCELLNRHGFEGMKEAMTVLINEAMRIERQKHLGAAPFERSESREGYANGFKPKTVTTRLGKLNLQVPQTRNCDFYPSALEKGLRSERALKLAIAEMYVQGVSTRKMATITEELIGSEVTSMQVSRAAKELDEVLSAWRDRQLSETPYLILDARYEKVRHGGRVIDCAVLVAVGVSVTGHRSVLGCSVSLSEAETHWREFMNALVARGLKGVRMIVSDDHAGLKAARRAVFPSVPWQRCQFHLQQNAQAYVPQNSMKVAVANDIRSIFQASDLPAANIALKQFVARYEDTAPKLAQWAEENLPEGLGVMALPSSHRRLLRTTNMLERQNKEIKRRTRVATLFPNTDSCLRLVSAVLMEVSEGWETGRVYLNMKTNDE